MTRNILGLVGLLCAFKLGAVTNHELIQNLSARLQELPEGRGTLIKSFESHSQSYIYDQALAIIAFVNESDQKKSRKLLQAMKSLQMPDGALYFSYYMDGKSPYPIEGDKRIAGAMAWVALSAVHYQHKFKDKEFVDFNHKLLTYLHSQILPIEINGKSMKALSFAPSDVKNTPFEEPDVAALEHNLDAYAAFYHYTRLNPGTDWSKEVQHLKTFILSMWDPKSSHFWSGASFRTGAINKSELYLDNQTWSLLALDKDALKEIAYSDALKMNCEKFLVKHEGIDGFYDSKPTRRPANHEFVWSEGTLGQVLAMKRLNENTCKDKTSEDFISSIKKMKQPDGGIAYATPSKNTDFTTSSSVAGTAWMYFASNGLNPFELKFN